RRAGQLPGALGGAAGRAAKIADDLGLGSLVAGRWRIDARDLGLIAVDWRPRLMPSASTAAAAIAAPVHIQSRFARDMDSGLADEAPVPSRRAAWIRFQISSRGTAPGSLYSLAPCSTIWSMRLSVMRCDLP